MEFRKQAHAVYHCQYHLVLPTKYRRNIFNDGILAYLRERLKEITRYYPMIGIEEDA